MLPETECHSTLSWVKSVLKYKMRNSPDITILVQWDESEGPWCSRTFMSLWKHLNSLIDLRSAELNRLLHETSGDRCCLHTNKLHRDQMVEDGGLLCSMLMRCCIPSLFLLTLFLQWLAGFSLLLCNAWTFYFENTSLKNHVK